MPTKIKDYQFVPDTDPTLGSNSDEKTPSQKAVRTFVTNRFLWHTLFFSVEGNLAVGEKPLRIYVPCNMTIDHVFIAVGTAPQGNSIIVDVNKNGTTIFTSGSNRPTIVAGSNTGSGVPDITTLTTNDYLTFDIDQVGSTVAGADLTVHVRCKQYLS